jgi:hypothetical protein
MQADAESAQEIGWRTVLYSCSEHTRKVARMWLAYTLFYWLIPTVIVICGLAIAKKPIKILDLVIHGELLIYSITLIAGSTRLITKDLPAAGPFVNRQGFNLVSHIMIFPAIFAYGLIRYIGSTADPSAVSKPIVVTYSVILLIGAFIFSYVVFVIDAQRSTPEDVQSRASQAIAHTSDRLNEDFNRLQSQGSAVANDQTQISLEAQFDGPAGGE